MLTFIDTQWSVMLSVPPFKLQSSFTLSLMYAPSLRQTLLLLLFKISHQRFPSDNLSLSPPLDVQQHNKHTTQCCNQGDRALLEHKSSVLRLSMRLSTYQLRVTTPVAKPKEVCLFKFFYSLSYQLLGCSTPCGSVAVQSTPEMEEDRRGSQINIISESVNEKMMVIPGRLRKQKS